MSETGSALSVRVRRALRVEWEEDKGDAWRPGQSPGKAMLVHINLLLALMKEGKEREIILTP
jgi:hypothetical protein